MTIIYSTTSGQYGTYYPATGAYSAELDVWNPATANYSGANYTAGSTTVTGFSSTVGIEPGMSVYTWPDNIGNNPWPTVVSVGASSIVMSAPSLITSTNEDTEFGLQNNGVMYDLNITTPSTTSPNGTIINWSFPSTPNDSDVYAYPHITYGNDLGYPSTTGVPSLQVSAITNLSVTYNISVSAATNPATYDCLIETFATSIPNPTDGTTATNEIGFLAHTPAELASYILSLPNHFNYSAGGLNAYIVTAPYGTPETLIMPVTTPGGTTPLDMISGTYTVQLNAILAALVQQGILSSNSYIDNWQTGFEVVDGSGSATVNSLSYDWNGTAASGPNAINDLITELYVGYYNHAPDPAGENYWVTQLAGGMSLSAIAQSYSVQTESTALYPFLASPNTASTAAIDSFIAAIYENLFGRAPDAAGQTYYVQQLQNGQNTVGGTIIAIESGAQASDLLILNNKLVVGDYFDTQIFNNNVQFSQSVALAALAAVTANASSVTTAEAIISTYIKTAPHASAAASQAEVGLVGVSPSHDLAVAA
jgi:hypothetical protein